LTTEQVASWGWRIPFVGSIVFCIAGWYLRRGIHETEEGLKAAAVRAPRSHRSSPTGCRFCARSALSR
jgi:hypothetical protein